MWAVGATMERVCVLSSTGPQPLAKRVMRDSICESGRAVITSVLLTVIAQLVERTAFNRMVLGSSPNGGDWNLFWPPTARIITLLRTDTGGTRRYPPACATRRTHRMYIRGSALSRTAACGTAGTSVSVLVNPPCASAHCTVVGDGCPGIYSCGRTTSHDYRSWLFNNQVEMVPILTWL